MLEMSAVCQPGLGWPRQCVAGLYTARKGSQAARPRMGEREPIFKGRELL